jgi:hypothetical protein
MTVRTQDEEIQIIKAALDAYPKFKGVEANERLLLEACQGKPIISVRAVIESVKHKLALNSDYAEAYRQLWARYSEYKLESNVNILDARVAVYQTIDYDILRKLVENPKVREQLSLTPRAVQANADAAERLRLIEEILQGQDKYNWRDTQDGRLRVGHRSELEQDSLERLQFIHDFVQGQRSLYAADTKELRETQRKKELREAQIRAGMVTKPDFVPVPDFYESPSRPGVKQTWSENLLRRLPNSEIERVFNLYGEQALTAACRKSSVL